MKYLLNYKTFEHVQVVTVKVMTYDDMVKEYHKDNSIEKRIRFLDLRYDSPVNDFKYFALFIVDKMIGLCKLGYFSNSAKNEKDYSITMLSIDKECRNNGYARMLADYVFKWAKDNGYSIRSSSYTYVGNIKLKHVFRDLAKKYGVDFYDQDEFFIDGEHQYNSDLTHKDESLCITNEKYSDYIYKIEDYLQNTGVKIDMFSNDLPDDVAGRIDYKKKLIKLNTPDAKQALIAIAHEGGHWLSYLKLKDNGKDYDRDEREKMAKEYGWDIMVKFGADKVVNKKEWNDNH